MPNQKQEEWCIGKLIDYLRHKFPQLTIREPQRGQEPPDYWLEMDKQRVAIEITTLRNESDSVVPKWRDFVKRIENDLISQGKLNGAYFVSFDSPLPCDKKSKREIRNQILEFIASTPTDIAVAEIQSIIEAGNRSYCEISRIRSRRKYLLWGGSACAEGMSAYEADEIWKKLFKSAIATKKEKMRGITNSKILLLYDVSGLTEEPEIASELHCEMEDGGFDGVYVIDSAGNSIVCVWSRPGSVFRHRPLT